MTFRIHVLLSLLVLAVAAPARAACGPAALGTHRTLAVTTTGGPAYGTKQYPGTLPLADGEFVLTFDDGPAAATTAKVLAALSAECVRATFFLIGRNAAGLPALAARTAQEGHTIANHTYSHPWTIDRLSADKGLAEVDNGEAAIRKAIGGSGHLARFLRFPGFVETAALRSELSRRNVAVFGADLWASDWNDMTPDAQLAQVLSRMASAKKGMVLFHDTRSQTAAMLPALLRAMKARGYRVVHVTG